MFTCGASVMDVCICRDFCVFLHVSTVNRYLRMMSTGKISKLQIKRKTEKTPTPFPSVLNLTVICPEPFPLQIGKGLRKEEEGE